MAQHDDMHTRGRRPDHGRGGAALSELEALLIETVSTSRQPFVVLDSDLTVRHANRAFYDLFQVDAAETLGQRFFALGNGQWDGTELRRLLGEVLPRANEVTDYPVERDFEQIGRRRMLLNARTLSGRGAFPDKVLVAFEDVTERDRLQQELLVRSEFSDKLIDSLREAVLVLTPELRVERVNHSFCEMFRVTPEQAIGKYVYELGNGQWDLPELRRLLEEVLPRQQAFDDYEIQHEFEAIGWRLMTLNARRLDHVPLILLTIRDLTDSQLSRRRLQESQQRLELAQRVGRIGVFEWDAVSGKVVWTEQLERLFGLAPGSFEGTYEAWAQRLEPQEADRLQAQFADWSRQGVEQAHYEYRFRRPDGEQRWMEGHAQLSYTTDGRLRRMLGTNIDVTERKATEAKLQRLTAALEQQVAARTRELAMERDFVDAILDNQPAPVLVVDAEGRILRFNKACVAASGYDFNELRGTMGWWELVPPAERAAVERLMAQLQDSPGTVRHENHWRHRDGTQRLFSWNISVIRDASGQVRYLVGSGVDITEQRHAEQEARRHLEEASRLQRLQTVNELATVLAHEVNQPLGAITMLADAGQQMLGADVPDRERLRRNLEDISAQAVRGSEIIKRLRTFVRREEGAPTPLVLDEVVDSARTLIVPQAKRYGVKIRVRKIDPLPRVVGVRVHLEQVLLNLLHNAVEAIHEAGVRDGLIAIELRRHGDKALVTVRDNGPGIPAAGVQDLFNPLRSSKVYGLGVGLRISRSLVEAAGGRLWVEPQQPGGVIHFEVPLPS